MMMPLSCFVVSLFVVLEMRGEGKTVRKQLSIHALAKYYMSLWANYHGINVLKN